MFNLMAITMLWLFVDVMDFIGFKLIGYWVFFALF